MAQDTPFVRGYEKLSRRIATIRASLAVPPLTEAIGRLLLKRTLERFDREVDPDGQRWRELEPETLARRGRANGGSGKKILNATGQMRGAIRIIRGADAVGAVYTNTGARVRIGISDPDQVGKARAHQRGYRHIPVRRFLGIGALDVRAVDGLLRRAAAKAEL